MTRKPTRLTGALIGALLTAPLLALIFLGHQVVGLPFLPSDFFNPVRDIVPGGLITFTIDTIIELIRVLGLGRVDQAAKNIEIAMAIGMVAFVGVVSGAVFFAVFNRVERRSLLTGGVIGGLVVGLPMALISLTYGVTSSVDPRAVGAVWLVLLFILWGIAHALVYRRLALDEASQPSAAPITVSAQPINRRQFLVTVGAASATLTVVGVGALLRRDFDQLEASAVAQAGTRDAADGIEVPPPSNLDDPVIPAPGTRPEITPVEDHYRIDISIVPPVIDEATWVLPFVTRLGGEERTLAQFTLDQLKAYEPTSAYITMSCISNRVAGDLISTTYWTGVSLRRLLQDVPLPQGATHLKITSADGFDETVALDLIERDERIMLAYYWAGRPLETEHGFPLRIHIPDLFGMKQPKWITRIDVLDRDEDGYWVRRGWDKIAQARATSVIDTVAGSSVFQDGDTYRVPVGGMAWAGARGISRVEVSVDDGDWQPAQLRAPASDRTWYIWRYDWPFEAGPHWFRVRCIEGDGTPQIEAVEGARPSGATGIHAKSGNVPPLPQSS